MAIVVMQPRLSRDAFLRACGVEVELLASHVRIGAVRVCQDLTLDRTDPMRHYIEADVTVPGPCATAESVEARAEPEKPPKFKVGDLVQHRASKRRGVVVEAGVKADRFEVAYDFDAEDWCAAEELELAPAGCCYPI